MRSVSTRRCTKLGTFRTVHKMIFAGNMAYSRPDIRLMAASAYDGQILRSLLLLTDMAKRFECSINPERPDVTQRERDRNEQEYIPIEQVVRQDSRFGSFSIEPPNSCGLASSTRESTACMMIVHCSVIELLGIFSPFANGL